MLVGVVLVPQKLNTSITLSHTADIHRCSHCSGPHFRLRKSWCTNGLQYRDNGNASGPSFPQLNFPPSDTIPELHSIPESYTDIHQRVLEEPHLADFEGPSGLYIIPESCTGIDRHVLEEPDSADFEGPSGLCLIPESCTGIDQHVLEEPHSADFEGPSRLYIIPESCTGIDQHVLEEPHFADSEGPSRLYIIPESNFLLI